MKHYDRLSHLIADLMGYPVVRHPLPVPERGLAVIFVEEAGEPPSSAPDVPLNDRWLLRSKRPAS